jgi:hypothetical protein
MRGWAQDRTGQDSGARMMKPRLPVRGKKVSWLTRVESKNIPKKVGVTASPHTLMTSSTTSLTIAIICHANEMEHVSVEKEYIQRAYKAPLGAYNTSASFPRFFSFLSL